MFEITSDYGMSPGKPLEIMLALTFALSLFYGSRLWSPFRNSKIIASASRPVFDELVNRFPAAARQKLIQEGKGGFEINYRFFCITLWQKCKRSGTGPILLRVVSSYLGGFYFSCLSTFRLGWRDLNVGTWMSRIQPREYTLQATGWVKFVSGLQSLISVYLIALWALTYFGRPFE